MIGISTCPTCKKEFKWKRNTANGAAVYCSNECRPKKEFCNVNCQICGKRFEYYRSPKRHKARFCSNECRFQARYWIKFEWKNLNEKEKLEKYKEGFEKYVIRQEGCWDWKGPLDKDNYSRLPFKKTQSGHRISYIIHNGEIPKGMMVCHHCDNPICTNPDHLFIGTAKDNSNDMVKKGRSGKGILKPELGKKGSKNKSSKLNEIQVKEIKKMLGLGVTGERLAKDYNVNKSTISKIKRNESWKHVQ